jgi:Ni,Fe-hydrogenase III large subunit
MAITIPHSFVSGTIAEASEMNANMTAISSYVNGLSDGTNIDSSAITNVKLATNAVSTLKIADGAVTYAKLDSSVAENDQIILAGQVFG